LEDQDPERVEELGDLLPERRAARDRDPEPPAEPLADLRVDQPVGEAVLERERGRDGLSSLTTRADLPADGQGPEHDPPLRAGLRVEARRQSDVDLLVDA